MLRKPLTHLVVTLSLIALWFAVPGKHRSQPSTDTTPTQSQTAQPPQPVAKRSGLQFDLPSEDVEVQQNGSTARLDVDMTKHKRIAIELEFSGPSVGYSFHLGDSHSRNGHDGDGNIKMNDAELQILNGNLEIYGTDRFDFTEVAPKDRFIKRRKNVAGTGRIVRLEIADREVTYIDEKGQRHNYRHRSLFAFSPRGYDMDLGVNRKVMGRLTGSGVDKVKVRFLD